jgi:hypothetical protein
VRFHRSLLWCVPASAQNGQPCRAARLFLTPQSPMLSRRSDRRTARGRLCVPAMSDRTETVICFIMVAITATALAIGAGFFH